MIRHAIQVLMAMLVFCGCAIGRLCAEEPFTSPSKVTNAALVYWQAFALLPELSEDDTELLIQLENDTKPLEKAETLLARSRLALNFTRHVKQDTPCRWELIEEGPSTLLPHLSKARLLARLLVLQAKVDAEARNDAAAVDHLTRALLIARNVDEGVLVQMLVGDAIESLVMDAAEMRLATLDGLSLEQFADALSNLPPRTKFSQAMRYERDVFAEWMRPIMTGDIEEARKKLKQLGVGSNSGDLVTILSGTKKNRMHRFEEFLAAYGKIIDASKLPLAKAEQEFKRLEASFEESANPLVRLLMPAVGRANERHLEIDSRFAKFEIAVRKAAKSAGKGN